MLRGRAENQWQHTASILAMLVNVNKAPEAHTVEPKDFMPKELRPKIVATKADLASLRRAAEGKKKT